MLLDLYSLYSPPGSPLFFAQRILSLLPDAWTSDDAKQPGGVLYGLALALANPLADLNAAISYQQLQTRLTTATDFNLDLISADFFGGALPRNPGEADNSFRTRIQQALFQNKVTRAGVASALGAFGVMYKIVEDQTPTDIMALGTRGGMGTYLALGAAGGANTSVYITVTLPLPVGVTQPMVIAAINAAKPEGGRVWLAFH